MNWTGCHTIAALPIHTHRHRNSKNAPFFMLIRSLVSEELSAIGKPFTNRVRATFGSQRERGFAVRTRLEQALTP